MRKPGIFLIGVGIFSLLVVAFATNLIAGCSPQEAVYITGEELSTATRFVDENGTPYGIAHVNNKPQVVSIPFTFEVARGNAPNYSSVNKFGHNPNVAANIETVWTGSNLYPWMTVADQFEVFSADADDTSGGAGARTVELEGLDINYEPITETVTLNGTGVVTTTLEFFRIYRAIIRSAGASGWNEGLITIRDQDTDVARAFIDAEENQTLMAVFTVQAGQSGFITSWYGGTSLQKDTRVALYVRPLGEVFQIKRHIHVTQGSYSNRFDFPEVITEKSDIEIRAGASGGGGDVSAGFFLWCEEH